MEEVNAAYDAAVKSINETPTKIDELRKEKLTALSAEYLSRNGAEGLTEEQKAALLSAYDEGKAAVSAAVTEPGNKRGIRSGRFGDEQRNGISPFIDCILDSFALSQGNLFLIISIKARRLIIYRRRRMFFF